MLGNCSSYLCVHYFTLTSCSWIFSLQRSSSLINTPLRRDGHEGRGRVQAVQQQAIECKSAKGGQKVNLALSIYNKQYAVHILELDGSMIQAVMDVENLCCFGLDYLLLRKS